MNPTALVRVLNADSHTKMLGHRLRDARYSILPPFIFSIMENFDDIKFFLLYNDMNIWAVEQEEDTLIVFVRERFRMTEIHGIKRTFPNWNIILKLLSNPE